MNPVALTDAGFCAGEAPVLGHHVGVVALAGQHLRHLRGPLPLPHLGLQENPEAYVQTEKPASCASAQKKCQQKSAI